MIYNKLTFKLNSNRPFFYTSFVESLDGKVQVLKNSLAYWPIGSSIDHQVFTKLRSLSDMAIQGKNTALLFGQRTLNSFSKEAFKNAREKNGKSRDIVYMIISNHPDDSLAKPLKNSTGITPFLITSEKAQVSQKLAGIVKVLRFGEKEIDLIAFSAYLFKQGLKHVLIEGGPTLLASFLNVNLVDEIFLTITPKIFGGGKDLTLTLVEGYLFPPKDIKKFKLISVKKVGNEVFLRYRLAS